MVATLAGTHGFVAWVDDGHVVQVAEGVCASAAMREFGGRFPDQAAQQIVVKVGADQLHVPEGRLCATEGEALDALMRDLATECQQKIWAGLRATLASVADLAGDLTAAELRKLGIKAAGERVGLADFGTQIENAAVTRANAFTSGRVGDLDRTATQKWAELATAIGELQFAIKKPPRRKARPRPKRKAVKR